MRQTFSIPAILLGLLAILHSGFAEPIIGGRFLEKPPAVMGDNSLFLAHCYNPDKQAIKGKDLQIGLEMKNKTGKKVFVIKPTEDLLPGQIKTYRFRITPSSKEKKGQFRIFTRVEGQTHFSGAYTFKNEPTKGGEAVCIPIYTEAPPEALSPRWGVCPPKAMDGVSLGGPSRTPPNAVPFENETSSIPLPVPVVQPPKKGSNPITDKGDAPVVALRPKVLDPKEFKTLHTIDEELVIYVVKKGDTLKSISEKYYGAPTKEKAIAEFNFIENPGSIKSGEEIIVDVLPLKKNRDKEKTAVNIDLQGLDPTSSADPEKGAAPKDIRHPWLFGGIHPIVGIGDDKKSSRKHSKSDSSKTQVSIYIIKSGDSLAAIAKKHYGKASFAARILKANPGLNTRNLKTGNEIILPAYDGKRA